MKFAVCARPTIGIWIPRCLLRLVYASASRWRRGFGVDPTTSLSIQSSASREGVVCAVNRQAARGLFLCLWMVRGGSCWIPWLSSGQTVMNGNWDRLAVFGDGAQWYWTTNVVPANVKVQAVARENRLIPKTAFWADQSRSSTFASWLGYCVSLPVGRCWSTNQASLYLCCIWNLKITKKIKIIIIMLK